MAIKSKYSNHIKAQTRVDTKRTSNEMEDDSNLQIQQQHQPIQQQQQQQGLPVSAFANKPAEIIKEKPQEAIQMPLSFGNKTEDTADMKLDFTFDSELTQLTEEKSKSLGIARSMHIAGGQNTISPSTAELNLKIASVKKVWENAPMPTVVEHEDSSVVNTSSSFNPQAFESNDVDDSYGSHQQYNQANMKTEINTSTNVCKVKNINI